MDPLTRAAQDFTHQLAVAWRSAPVVLLVATPEHRAHLVRSLRLHEWAPDNRWPLVLIETSADDLTTLYSAASERLLADFAALHTGLCDDGITVSDPAALTHDLPPDPLRRLQLLLARAGEVLARTGILDGLALAFVPPRPPPTTTLRDLAQTLRDWPRTRHHRLALATPEVPELAALLPGTASFRLDDDALHAYCQAQGERQAAASTPADAALRRHLLAASDAAHRRDLPAARTAYLHASTALEQQGRRSEAAVVHVALGGITFGLKDTRAALDHFDRAVAHGAAVDQPNLLAQAHFGAAGVLFAQGDLAGAARRYDLASRTTAPDALRIEALRMAGTCHLQRNDHESAAHAWDEAVAIGTPLPPRTRAATSWKTAGESLLALLQQRGLTAQATHLRALLQP